MATRGSSATLSIVIAGDNQGARRAIQGTEQDLSGLGDKIKTTAADMAKAFVAVKGAQFLNDAIQSAASLEQAQGQVDAVFGESAGSVRTFGEEAVDSIGQSEKVALQAAGSFGTLFTGMGVGQAQAADMSKTMLALASDMAAAKDVPVDEAITALFSGLSGEQEPLKRFGVLINEATVKAKALELGLHDGEGALDGATRAQATYALILEKTSVYQGTFAREADTLATQQQKLSAEWENAKTQLGTELVPAMKLATEAGVGMVDMWSSLPGEVQVGLLALGGYALVGSQVTSAVGSGVTALKEMRVAIQGIAATRGISTTAASMEVLKASTIGAEGVFRRNLSTVNRTTVALSAVTAGVTAYAATTAALNQLSEWESIGADVERLSLSFESLANNGVVAGEALSAYGEDLSGLVDLVKGTDEGVWDRFFPDDFGDLAANLTGPIGILANMGVEGRALKDDLDDADQALVRLFERDPGKAAESYGQIANALMLQGVSAEDVAAAFDNYNDAVSDGTLATDENTDATEDGADAADEAAAAKEREAEAERRATRAKERALEFTEKTRDAALREFDAALALEDAERSTTEAQEDAADAQADLAEARRAAAGDSDEYRDAVEAVGDAEKGVTEALKGHEDAQEAVGDAIRGVDDAVQAQRDAEEAVTEAIRRQQDARESLTEAQEEAQQQIEDLARAARDAVLDEEGAELAVRRAQEKLAQVMADESSSQLDRDEASLALREAQEAARQAGEDTVTAQQEAAEAARLGIEGNEQVIAARQALAEAGRGVVDAERGVARAADGVREAQDRVRDAHDRVREASDRVREAQDRVGDAKRRVSQVSRDAAQRVVEAEKRVEDSQRKVERAALDEAEAAADAAEAHGGAAAGIQTHIEKLLILAETLAPNNPLRARIRALVDELGGALTPNAPDGVDGRPGTGSSAGEGPGRRSVGDGPKVEINAPMTVIGSSVEVQRETKRRQQEFIDEIGKAVTGG